MRQILYELFSQFRLSVAGQTVFDGLHFLTVPITKIDDHFADQKTQIKKSLLSITRKNQDLILKINESSIVALYVSTCSQHLTLKENDFLYEFSRLYPLVHVVNCNEHDEHRGNSKRMTVTRLNKGRDLAAYRDILNLLKNVLAHKNLVFFNSSCIWNSQKTDSIVGELVDSSPELVYFMTDSFQRKYHYQTYFIFIPKSLGNEQFLMQIFSHVKNWKLKRTIVELGEMELTKVVEKFNVTAKPIYPISDFIDISRKREFINPSIMLAGDLLNKGAPFIKKTSPLYKISNPY